MTIREKRFLGRTVGMQKRKLAVTKYFSELTVLQFGKKIPQMFCTCILKLLELLLLHYP